MSGRTRARLLFAAAGVAVVAAAVALRVNGVSRQLLLADEWHALHAAARLSFGELFTLMTPGATSIPFNLWDRLLLACDIGWSEFTLRLPSLAAGAALVALVLLLPRLLQSDASRSSGAGARAIVPPRVALLAAALCAVSPFLVVVARMARPYAVVAFLALAIVVAGHRLARGGGRWTFAAFVVAGAAATFTHLVEARVAIVVIAALLGARLVRGSGVVAPAGRLVAALAAVLALSAALLGPAYVATGERFFAGLQSGATDFRAFAGAAAILAGAWNRPAPLAHGVAALFALLAVGGAAVSWRRDRLFAALSVATIVAVAMVVAITHPVQADQPIVVARYLAPAAPLVLLLVAAGLDGVLARVHTARPALAAACMAAFVAAWFALGPLPATWRAPDDFMSHKAFQVAAGDSGSRFAAFRRAFVGPDGPDGPDDSDGAAQPAISAAYARIAADPVQGGVIEAPFVVGDVFQFLAVAQEIHGRRVLGGYRRQEATQQQGSLPGLVQAGWTAGAVLGLVEANALHLHAFVDLDDADAVRRSGAAFLVLHHDLARELRGVAPEVTAPAWADAIAARFGATWHRDAWITVVRIAR